MPYESFVHRYALLCFLMQLLLSTYLFFSAILCYLFNRAR